MTLLSDAQATRANIIAALDQLAARTTLDSIVFVFYAGTESGSTAVHCAASIFARRRAEERQCRCVPKLRHLRRRVWRQAQGHQSAELVVVLDCCHAEGKSDCCVTQKETPSVRVCRKTICRVWLQVPVALSRQPLAARARVGWQQSNGLGYGAPASRSARRRWRQRRVHPHLRSHNYIQPRVVKERPTQNPVFKAELREDFAVAMRLGGRGDGPLPPAKGTTRPAESYTRAEVYRLMCRLLPSQFEELLLLDIPVHSCRLRLLPSPCVPARSSTTGREAERHRLPKLVEALPFH